MAAPIDFYFDFSSPYGYLASTRIDDLAQKHGRKVVWRPILLGAVFKVSGGQPLPSIPMKGEYGLHDFQRFARFLSVPFVMPPKFPFAAIPASRAVYWLAGTDQAQANALAKALFAAAFAEGRDISGTEAVVDAAATLGIDAGTVTAAVQSAEVKEALRVAVDAAIQRKVFGSPMVVVDGEMFWGADRLTQVDRWLATGGW